MPPLDNPQHERFAQLLKQGMPVRQAYVAAGYKWNNGNAYRLKDSERVKERMRELHAQDVMVANLAPSFVIGGLMRIAANQEDKNPAAAANAYKLLGQLESMGLFVERSKQDINLLDMIQRATPEDKVTLIQELSTRLGLTKAEDLLDG